MKSKFIGLVLITLFAFGACSSDSDYDLFTSIHGSVYDHETSAPLEGATVVLSPGGLSKVTGSDGLFEFSELDVTQYTVTVQKDNYQTNRKSITTVVGEKSEINIPLTKTK